MTIFTETTFRHQPQGGMFADATGPFSGAAVQPYTLLGAPASPSNSLADDLLVRLAGRPGAGTQQGSAPWEITRADVEAAGAGMFAAKEDRVGRRTPDEMVAQAFGDDLPQEEQATLTRKAQAAGTAQQAELRTNIGLAEVHAPDAIARTGAYAGKMPGRDAFRIAYGLDEGDRRRQGLEWQVGLNKQVFDMRTMTNKDVNAAFLNATSEPGVSQEDNLHRLATGVAAMRVLIGRRTDAWGSAAESMPAIATAWDAVVGGGLEDPNGYDKEAYDKAITMALAAQERLGIENPQLVPQHIIQELSDNRDSPSTYQQEKNAKIVALLAKTSGPVARAAVGRQLAAAGLGWIMPSETGYLPPSTSSIFASEAKALGKLAANAGIFLGQVSDQMGANLASLGGASIKSPENKDVYYEPANDVESLMMHQGSDAATWALGEGAGKGITRAIEWLGSRAAGQAERSIGGLEAANAPTSKVAPGQAADAGAKSETGTSLYSYYPPNDGFLGPVVEEMLPVGTRIDRYGTETGAFVAPEGTPVWMRSLVPGTVESKPYNVYEVAKPVKVLSGKSAPWFGQGGGGKQYKFYTSIGDAIDVSKYLKRLTE